MTDERQTTKAPGDGKKIVNPNITGKQGWLIVISLLVVVVVASELIGGRTDEIPQPVAKQAPHPTSYFDRSPAEFQAALPFLKGPPTKEVTEFTDATTGEPLYRYKWETVYWENAGGKASLKVLLNGSELRTSIVSISGTTISMAENSDEIRKGKTKLDEDVKQLVRFVTGVDFRLSTHPVGDTGVANDPIGQYIAHVQRTETSKGYSGLVMLDARKKVSQKK